MDNSVPPDTTPNAGFTASNSGTGTNSNTTPSSVGLHSSPLLATASGTDAGTWGGDVHVSITSDTNTAGTATSPNRHARVGVLRNPAPVNVTAVAPRSDPHRGRTASSRGVGVYRNRTVLHGNTAWSRVTPSADTATGTYVASSCSSAAGASHTTSTPTTAAVVPLSAFTTATDDASTTTLPNWQNVAPAAACAAASAAVTPCSVVDTVTDVPPAGVPTGGSTATTAGSAWYTK